MACITLIQELATVQEGFPEGPSTRADTQELSSPVNSPQGLLGSQEVKAWLFHVHLKWSTNLLHNSRSDAPLQAPLGSTQT